MRNIFTLFIVLMTVQSFSQNFYFAPSNELTKTIYTDQTSDLNIDIIRENTVDTLYLEYELVTNTLPEDWYQAYCDNYGCWGSLPQSGYMSPCFDDINSFIKLSIDPDDIEGSGTVSYYVYETDHYEDGLLMTFNIETPGYVSLEETSKNSILLYPNPASDFIHLQSDDKWVKLCIYSITGQLVEEIRNINNSANIDISHLEIGIYLLRTMNINGEEYTQKLKKF